MSEIITRNGGCCEVKKCECCNRLNQPVRNEFADEAACENRHSIQYQNRGCGSQDNVFQLVLRSKRNQHELRLIAHLCDELGKKHL